MRLYELVKIIIWTCLSLFTGLYSLAQSNSLCRDSNTVRRYYAAQTFVGSRNMPLQDGGSLTWGGEIDSYSSFNYTSIFRTDASGQVLWSTQLLPETNANFPQVNIIQSTNGNFMVSGTAKFSTDNAPQYFFVACLNSSGILLWHHFYKSQINSLQIEYPTVSAAATDMAGDFYVAINYSEKTPGDSSAVVVCKLNDAGLLLWNKAFILHNLHGAARFLGAFVHNDTLTLLSSTSTLTAFVNMQLNTSNALVINLKAFSPVGYRVFPGTTSVYKINGDRYVLSGEHHSGNGDFSGIDFHTLVFDRQLMPVTSFHVKTFPVYYANGWGGINKNIVPTPEGELLYGMARSGENSFYYGLVDTNYQVTVQKKLQYANPSSSNFYLPPLRYYKEGKVFIHSTGCSPTTGQCGLDYLSFDKDIVQTNNCFSVHDTAFLELIPFNLTPIPFSWDDIEDNVLQKVPVSLTQQTTAFTVEEVCKEINLCEKPVITGPDSICLGTAETYFTVHKNTQCFKKINWTIDSGAIQATRIVNDTTIGIVFKKNWKGFIIAAINGNCNSLIDSLPVVVYKEIPAAVLGNDTSLCEGDTLRLHVGDGFNSYAWNTGTTTSNIDVSAKGIYSVKAFLNNGCYLTDSLEILQLFPPPAPSLSDKPFLCSGQQEVLYAGAGFSDYTWQDHSKESQFAVQLPGTYWVTVTDAHGCTGSDTVIIKEILSAPAQFLPADTILCLQETLRLQPSTTYQSYLWSNGATTTSIAVTGPGQYWLTVKDKYGCAGTDSITVSARICKKRVYFPTAFSPDGNHTNDVFKPIIDGKTSYYELAIYNRWGQLIFKTNNPSAGWNGQWQGKLQRNTSVVWMCSYQFGQEPRVTEKGMLTIL